MKVERIQKIVNKILTKRPERLVHLIDENDSLSLTDLANLKRFKRREATVEEIQTALQADSSVVVANGRVKLVPQ